jgi:predicted DsbA family dithiol-disulfide isomerase
VQTLRLDIWSDIACPWCYIGKRHLEQALATFEHAGAVEIVWRAFELDPRAPRVRDAAVEGSYAERLAKKYGVTPAQGEQMIARVVGAGARAGIEFRYDRIQSGNTFDAHRLLHWAHAEGAPGAQGALKERLLRAYMTEGVAIGEPDAIAPLVVDVGLDVDAAKAILAGDTYAAEVRADERLARELGISGVPFFVMAGQLGVSGAQPPETMAAALAQAWTLAAPTLAGMAAGGADGAACGPDGCDPV